MQTKKHIILFDGVCNLCNGAVQFVIKHDKKNSFLFASLQSEIGQKLFVDSKLKIGDTDSFVLIANQQYFVRSTAALQVFKLLGGRWKLLYAFIILPRFLRDAVYNFIAKNRYKFFGKKAACLLPTAATKAKFLV